MADKTNIYTKLLAFQKLGVSIKKGSKNPHFKSSYADISEVLDKVKPALSQVGITLIQLPQQDGLRTILHDADSDTMVDGFLPFIGATDPQKLGSNITYLRRYSLVAMLGLEDDDDDGQVASTPAPKAAVVPAMTAEYACGQLARAQSIDGLKIIFKGLPVALQKDPEVEAMKEQMKAKFTNVTE